MTREWKQIFIVAGFLVVGSGTAAGQTRPPMTAERAPSKAIRPVVVLSAQSVADVEKKLAAENKVEDLIGGEGMQLRVAIQHEKGKSDAAAELHDASDDVYYITEGSATLVLGGTLEAPREVEPGEWRSARIVGGKTYEVAKGDLIIVPRGTPHQRNTGGKDFTMILIKVFAEPRAMQPKPGR
jgi:mannose-6-phosphate isomerase-like protein (cupin superfamily)